MAFMIVKVAQAIAGLLLLAVIGFGSIKLLNILLRGMKPETTHKRGKRK